MTQLCIDLFDDLYLIKIFKEIIHFWGISNRSCTVPSLTYKHNDTQAQCTPSVRTAMYQCDIIFTSNRINPSSTTIFVESVKQGQLAHTCSLFLFYTFRSSSINIVLWLATREKGHSDICVKSSFKSACAVLAG